MMMVDLTWEHEGAVPGLKDRRLSRHQWMRPASDLEEGCLVTVLQAKYPQGGGLGKCGDPSVSGHEENVNTVWQMEEGLVTNKSLLFVKNH